MFNLKINVLCNMVIFKNPIKKYTYLATRKKFSPKVLKEVSQNLNDTKQTYHDKNEAWNSIWLWNRK